MKVRAALLAAASLSLLPYAWAQDDADVNLDTDAVTAEEETPAAAAINIERPQFTPTNIKAPFLEQFTEDWTTRWQPSNAKKDTKEGEDEWKYVGTWAVEEPTIYKAIDGDKGLVVKDKAAHHAISAKFPKAIDPKGKTLVVQYEAKFQGGLECGGAYMKLLQDNKALHAEEFSNASPYIIMFGPDKCGSTNKVHFIFRHKNPKSGEYEEKHMSEDVYPQIDKTTSLYTLIIQPNNTFEVRVNGKSEKTGSLLEDFQPPVNPPKEIDDPEDKKPEDWVDTQKISDPEAVKPEDWDEDAPAEILDVDAVKPDDWLDDEPDTIPDPDAFKPDDWDDEEDGDWSPHRIPNPKCADVSGCGKWEQPMKKNPDYKGKWVAPLIDNPAYKGPWAPRKIANKNFFEDKSPSNLEPLGGIGFELWTMQSDILFDNIYIGHSVEDAEALKKETFDVKTPVEKKLEDATNPKDDGDDRQKTKLNRGEAGSFFENPVAYVRQQLDEFIPLFKADPKAAIMDMPEVAGGIGVVLVTVLALVVGSLGLGASSPQVQEQAKKAKDKAAEAKDKVADGVSTGAEKLQSEVNKRTTRSSN